VGVNKAESARRALLEINPDCLVVPVEHRVGERELMDLVATADVVVDACDNFTTRHAVNRACVKLRKPLVSGAAIRFAGQLAVFDLRRDDSPCYHCLFPDTRAEDEERCATMGVFAPLTGMVGTLQAGEAMRLLLGAPSPLAGRLVLFDAGSMEWQTMKVPKDPGCAVCGRG
jgi:adenylyltransferase/sulfurtransferase